MALNAGAIIAGYRVESEVGRGSMGTVYLAHELALERAVALKVLVPELARDERFRERFLSESRLAASLEHPHIVPIYSAGEDDGHLFIAMRYVEGRDLDALLAGVGKLEPDQAVALLRQIAEALDTAHERGLVHRDVKPANILVARDSRGDLAYLCDFGLAKHASTVSSLTGDRAIIGTVDYLAPEQVEGRPVDGRVDVYALGCVLYQSLTGEPPFRRENELATVLAHASSPPPRITDRVDLPAGLDDVIASALAKNREDRYATCSELIDATAAALRGDHVDAPMRAAGVRTFVFADLRGYTAYTRTQGDEAGAALARGFEAVSAELTPEFGGTLQETRGDQVLVVFDSARSALRFAVALQNRLASGELARPVGVGIDSGEAVPVVGGFRGGALNRAARLCALAGPGQILASDAVRELAGSTPGVAYGLRRLERLKGFQKPVGAIEIHPVERAPRRELTRRALRAIRGTRPRLRLAVVSLLVLCGVGAAALLIVDRSHARLLPAESVGIFDAGSGKALASVDPGTTPYALLHGTGALYGMDVDASYLTKIDVAGRRTTDQFPIPPAPYWLLPRTAFGSIWVTDGHTPTVERIDPRYRQVVARIRLPDATNDGSLQRAEGIAATPNAIWVAFGYPIRVARIDPATNRVTLVRGLPEGAAWSFDVLLAASGQNLWAIARDGSRFVRLDERTGEVVARGKLHDGWVEDAAVAGGYLWVPMQSDSGVWQVDPTGSVVGKVATGARPIAAVVGDGALWVPNANAGTVTRIDPGSGATRTFTTGHSPVALAVTPGRVWVSLRPSASELRAHIHGTRVLTQVATGDPYFSTDPTAYGSNLLQLGLAHAIQANLMAYRPEPDGTARVVPELAAAAPDVLDGGRTFVFRLRPGFRFSPPSGAPVTAQAVRFSLERALSPKLSNPYCSEVLSKLVGEDDYRAGKSDHISGIAIAGDRIRISLVSPNSTLPAQLTAPCFSVVPIGTPTLPDGVFEPIPSAGPYYIDSHIDTEQLVLLPNPGYGGDRAKRLDAIVVKLGVDPVRAGRLVATGAADIAVDQSAQPTPAFAPGGTYDRRFGSTRKATAAGARYVRPSGGANWFLALNTTRGVLRDVRVRRALALAVDRRELAAAQGGDPASLIIPRGIPGYSAAQPYPARPQLARVHALLGGRHPTLVLAGNGDSARVAVLARRVKSELDAAGFRVRLELLADPEARAHAPGSRIDVILEGWIADYPDPSDFLNTLFAPPNAGGAGFMPTFFPNPAWQRRLAAAAALRGSARIRAYVRLDRQLATGPVPYVALVNSSGAPVLLSAHVGCATFLAPYGGVPDFGSLCRR